MGIFLAAILTRKLNVVEEKYKKSQLEFERYSVLAVGSIYGIDLQSDNVKEAERLLGIFTERYSKLFKSEVKADCIRSISFILDNNLVVGNALNMRVGKRQNIPMSCPNGHSLTEVKFSVETLSLRRWLIGYQLLVYFLILAIRDLRRQANAGVSCSHFLKIADVVE